MISDQVSSGSSRRVIPATCTQHGGASGFTNLAVSMRDGGVELDPHVTGGCVIQLEESGARTLSEALTEWFGWTACRMRA